MAKYRAKPVDAEQWEPGNIEQAQRLGISVYRMPDDHLDVASVCTRDGVKHLNPGDWIVIENGLKVAYTPGAFADVYDPA